MRKMTIVCFVAAFVGWQAEKVSANPPRFRTFHCPPAYVAPVYAAPVYAYAVGYQPDLSALAAAMLANTEETKAMREQLNQLVLNGGGNGKQYAPVHPGLALMKRDCAVCHDSGVAKQRGGGMVLFDRGQLIETKENIEAMIKAVDEGRMPKNKKWSGEEKYLHLSYHTLRPVEQPQTAGPEPQVQPQVDIERLIDQRLERYFERMSKQQQAPLPKKDDGDGEQPKKK